MTHFAEQTIDGLIRTGVVLSVGACLGWVVLKLFRVRSPRMHRFVWLAVLVQGWLFWRITLPVLPAGPAEDAVSSPTHVADVERIDMPVADGPLFVDSSDRRNQTFEPTGPHDAADPISAAGDSAADSSLSFVPFLSVLFGIWTAGIFAIVLRFAACYLRFLRGLSQATPAGREWRLEWEAVLQESKITSDIPLLLHSVGPLLCRVPGGYRLIVPPDLWESLAPGGRRAILLHEVAHFRRGDVWKSLLARALLLPQWFNPFAWLAVRRFDEAAEWACDDAVRRQEAQHIPDYARTLLELAAGQPTTAAYSPGAGGHVLAGRIRRLFQPLYSEDCLMKRTSLFTLVTALTLCGLFGFGPADANDPPQPADTATSPTSNRSQIPPKEVTTKRAAPRRKFKIDEAVIDPTVIVKKFVELPPYNRQMKQLKKEFAARNRQFRERWKAIQEIQLKLKRNVKNLDALKRELSKLQAAAEEHDKQSRQVESKEGRIWSDIRAKMQTEVARYAKEKGIRIVRRKKLVSDSDPSSPDWIVYRADERPDITKQILARMLKSQRARSNSRPEK